MPAATAAADPPLDPPAVRCVSWGLLVWPKSGWATPAANSRRLVLPKMIAPGVSQSSDAFRINGGKLRLYCPGCIAGPGSCDVDDVLDGDGHPMERSPVDAAGKFMRGARCLLHHVIRHGVDEGIELRFQQRQPFLCLTTYIERREKRRIDSRQRVLRWIERQYRSAWTSCLLLPENVRQDSTRPVQWQ